MCIQPRFFMVPEQPLTAAFPEKVFTCFVCCTKSHALSNHEILRAAHCFAHSAVHVSHSPMREEMPSFSQNYCFRFIEVTLARCFAFVCPLNPRPPCRCHPTGEVGSGSPLRLLVFNHDPSGPISITIPMRLRHRYTVWYDDQAAPPWPPAPPLPPLPRPGECRRRKTAQVIQASTPGFRCQAQRPTPTPVQIQYGSAGG